jgi:hypothetical protein
MTPVTASGPLAPQRDYYDHACSICGSLGVCAHREPEVEAAIRERNTLRQRRAAQPALPRPVARRAS